MNVLASWHGPGPWMGLMLALMTLMVVAMLLWRGARWRTRAGCGRWLTPAERVLAERYARGEISGDEYGERLGVLKERNP